MFFRMPEILYLTPYLKYKITLFHYSREMLLSMIIPKETSLFRYSRKTKAIIPLQKSPLFLFHYSSSAPEQVNCICVKCTTFCDLPELANPFGPMRKFWFANLLTCDNLRVHFASGLRASFTGNLRGQTVTFFLWGEGSGRVKGLIFFIYLRFFFFKPSFLAHRMSLGNVSKPYSSFFIGTSPEFELALYTICFLKFPDGECNCKINSRRVKITTYGMRGTNSLGTAYPDLY